VTFTYPLHFSLLSTKTLAWTKPAFSFLLSLVIDWSSTNKPKTNKCVAMDTNFFEPLVTTCRQKSMQRRETAQESFNIRESRNFTWSNFSAIIWTRFYTYSQSRCPVAGLWLGLFVYVRAATSHLNNAINAELGRPRRCESLVVTLSHLWCHNQLEATLLERLCKCGLVRNNVRT
jgi:hypothetical protein